MRPGIRLAIIFLCSFFVTLVALYGLVYLPLQDQTTTLPSVRPLAGTWTGTATFTDRVVSCVYQGPIALVLNQNGDHLTGYFDVTVDTSTNEPPCAQIGSNFRYTVDGTVSSSAVNLIVADTDTLKGSYVSNILTLRWEECQNCTSGPAIKFVGIVSLTK